MKALGITIIIFAIIFLIAAFIEKWSTDSMFAFYAECAKDLFGIVFCMLFMWFLYCVIY